MIHTVLGPIDSSGLGAVSMHEHLRSDSSGLYRPGVEPLDADAPVTAELAGALRWSQLAVKDNLRLDDQEMIVEELGVASRLGLRTLVESSSLGLGPVHAALPDIARRTGVNIVAAYGAYIPRLVPDWFRELDLDGRTAHFRGALSQGIPGSTYRAGMLGIMGTTQDFATAAGRDERTSLVAAARAAAAAGSAISIRLDAESRNGVSVIQACVDEGVSPDKIVLTNVDEYLDHGYVHELGETGVVLELCFGSEGGHLGRVRNASDNERVDFLLAMLDRDPDLRWVLGTSLWTKAQLRRFGGHGYGHLMARVIPGLIELGISEAVVTAMIVTQPARLLDRAA